MTTRLIGIKEFRRNLSKLSKEAHRKNICFVVMHHSVPIFKVEPLAEDDLIDELIIRNHEKEIRKGLQQMKRGQTFTPKEVAAMLRW